MLYIIAIICVALLLQFIELQRYKETGYEFRTDKIDEKLTICFLSDLHGRTYGRRLLETIRNMKPDVIIIGGDVVSKKKPKELTGMLPFLKELAEITTVYYCFGNHETTLDTVITINHPERRKDFEGYLESLEHYGIRLLRNVGVALNPKVYLSGVELPDIYYVKQDMRELTEEALHEIYEPSCQVSDHNMYHIVVAHQPAYAKIYESLQPDIILSGHTHGGLIRFPIVGSLISTELTFNPEFDGGYYKLPKGTDFIVSKGLGTHTYHIRIMDRAEVVKISIIPCKDTEKLVK